MDFEYKFSYNKKMKRIFLKVLKNDIKKTPITFKCKNEVNEIKDNFQIINVEKCNGTFIISGNNSLINFYLPLTKNDSYKVIENEDNFELSNITLFFFIPKKNEFNSINIILINLVIILLILHIILNMELFHILEILKKNIF